jgi:hypothetical protein
VKPIFGIDVLGSKRQPVCQQDDGASATCAVPYNGLSRDIAQASADACANQSPLTPVADMGKACLMYNNKRQNGE